MLMFDSRPVLTRFRENAFVVILIGYLMALLTSYAYYGVLFQFSLGLVFLILLPLTLFLGRTTQLIRELAPFLFLLLSYEALQGVAGSFASGPVVQIVPHTGTATTLSFVATIQTAFYSPGLTDAMSVVYGLHFPLVIASAILLWYSDKFLYKKYVYSLVACSYVSLLFYVLMPSAPPWYTGVATNLLEPGGTLQSPSNLISTLANIGELIESDKLAAFPSLHAAYIVLFCYFTLKLKKVYGIVSVPITIGVLFSTIYLGQHFIIDLVAGASVAAACVLIVTRVRIPGSNMSTSRKRLR